jgi:hypothetical protein
VFGKVIFGIFSSGCLAFSAEITSFTQAALEAALQEGGVIRFQTNGTIRLTNQLVVRKEVHLDGGGNNVAISGQGVPLLYITNTLFTAAGITFQDGIHRASNSYPSTFTTNPISAGGALQIVNSTVNLTNCHFFGNHSIGLPAKNNWVSGSEFGHGGAVFSDNKSILTIEACKFVGNSARGGPPVDYISTVGTPETVPSGRGYGGAVYSYGEGRIANSHFDSNLISGKGGGGALVIGKFTVERCTFFNNEIVADRSHLGRNQPDAYFYMEGGRRIRPFQSFATACFQITSYA